MQDTLDDTVFDPEHAREPIAPLRRRPRSASLMRRWLWALLAFAQLATAQGVDDAPVEKMSSEAKAEAEASAPSPNRSAEPVTPESVGRETFAPDPENSRGVSTTSQPAALVAPASSISASTSTSTSATPTGPALNRDLWDRIRAGYRLPELSSPLVANYERLYLSRPDALKRMFERGGRYLFFIVEEIERRGLPSELALLPFVESAMNPVAMSSAKAAGLWQFIPSTGRNYDLSQNWWVDQRRDVLQSTNAALGYLTRIYEMQGNDWFLALASYNWGEGAVQRAMRKNAARGRPTDYLSLDMPNETRHYVPKLMALRNIVARAQTTGFELPDIPNEPYFATLEKLRPIDLSLAARFAGMTVGEFLALNPAHNRPVITASRNNVIILPTERVQGFMEAMDQHASARKPLASWQPLTIRPGETIDAVARRSGLSGHELRRANGLNTQARLLPGTRILAPQKEVQDETLVEQFIAPRVYELVDTPAQRHLVGRQENMQSIANRYGITVAALRAWNGLRDTARRGMRLIVRPAQSQTVVTTEYGDRQIVKVALAEPDPLPPVPQSSAKSSPSAPIAPMVTAKAPTNPVAAPAIGPLRTAAVSNTAAAPRSERVPEPKRESNLKGRTASAPPVIAKGQPAKAENPRGARRAGQRESVKAPPPVKATEPKGARKAAPALRGRPARQR
ncbi:MAG: LysM peptidoglycan-binding domain-containing protein [Betaproteobacteria bacterium]|nr:LysM peptidoglycan-binding domain-containing protein [Betaproteobacteria bacterium]